MLGTTPMFLQYKKIKDHYSDMILFYRLGDFYEMFDEDAKEASHILGLALTARDGGNNIKVPMCGVPYHAADVYIKKLIKQGKKVAICEQVEDPKLVKGIVKRDVVRIVTPGMLIDDNMLEEGSNYIACIAGKKTFGLSVSDVSTGEFITMIVDDKDSLLQELCKYMPSECVISDDNVELFNFLNENQFLLLQMNISPYSTYLNKENNAIEKLKDHFKINDLSVLNFNHNGLNNDAPAIISAAVLLGYVEDMLKLEPKHLVQLKYQKNNGVMLLDLFSKKNLELVSSLSGNKNTTLFDILNKTSTSAGARLLRRWLEEPLIDAEHINLRLDATQELFENYLLRRTFGEFFKQIQDIERIASRISCKSATPRDLVSLKNSLLTLPEIKACLANCENRLFKEFYAQFDILDDVTKLISKSIKDEPAFQIKDGNVINPNYHEDLLELHELITNGEAWLKKYVESEKEKTGIKNLKVGYNKVFGYYLDVTKSYHALVPDSYIRKQTLANCERYITNELKEMENKLLTASERSKALEQYLFNQIIDQLEKSVKRMLLTSSILANIDVYLSFAMVSVENNYCKPTLMSDRFYLKDLRHPIIEKQVNLDEFTPNDILFDNKEQRFLIITGPNMSGKSTYCRSIALASIMMQIGCFVPAAKADMKVFDRVFARIGANDYLAGGQSTFMVEMNEVATILKNATRDSLIILDEVGRGTSTYDGLALATSISKYINTKIGACTLFATHYHELIQLEKEVGIKNFCVSVIENQEKIIFLHKIIPGGASKSYGIHVAQKAGVPREVISLAGEILNDLENTDAARLDKDYKIKDRVVVPAEPEWMIHLRNINIEDMSLREMASTLMDIVEKF